MQNEECSIATCEKQVDAVELNKFTSFLSLLRWLFDIEFLRGIWPPRIDSLITPLWRKTASIGGTEGWSRSSVDDFVDGAFLMLPDDYFTTRLKKVFRYANYEKPDKSKFKSAMMSFICAGFLLGKHAKEELVKILSKGSATTSEVCACLKYWAMRTTWSESFGSLPENLNITEVQKWAESQIEVLRQDEKKAGGQPLLRYASVSKNGETLVLDFSSGVSASHRNKWITLTFSFGNSATSCTVNWESTPDKFTGKRSPSESLSVERLLALLPQNDYRAES